MSEHKSMATNGLGFFEVLFLVFLVLKLTDVITWSWWFVTMPVYIPLAIVLIIIIFVLIFRRY